MIYSNRYYTPVTTFVEIANFSVFPPEEAKMANRTAKLYIRLKAR